MKHFLSQLKARNAALYYFGMVNLFCAVVCLVLSQATHVEVLGVNAFFKPAKFFLSTTIFVWTMGWLLAYLNEPRKVRVYNWVVILVFCFENGYILFRAARGELSHFNTTSPASIGLYAMMGVAISVMTLWTGYFALLFFQRKLAELQRHYVWGIRFGLLFFVIFASAGHVMATMMHHTVGAADGGAGIPFFNWSTQHGDLRIAHFLGMHSLQVLPLMGRYVSKRSIITVLLSVVYFLLVTAVFLQALISKPLMQFYLG